MRPTSRRLKFLALLGLVIGSAACSDVVDTVEPVRDTPQLSVGTEFRTEALRLARRLREERKASGQRDSVNVLRCVLRKQLPNGKFRSWKVVIAAPDGPGSSRTVGFRYRGVPETGGRATHTADCLIPNTKAAKDFAAQIFAGIPPRVANQASISAGNSGLKEVLSHALSTILPRPAFAQADVEYCFQQYEGWALCTLPGIEVTAPPPPPAFDDCGSNPDPYTSGLWCECYEYSTEPFWCSYEFDWQDWPVYEGGGGDTPGSVSASVNCSPANPTRGGEVTCAASVNSGPLLVTKWTFFPQTGSEFDPLVRNSSDSTWTGTMVAGGTVTVEVMDGTSSTQASTSISVSPRESGIWTQTHWESSLSFVAGQGSSNCKQSQRVASGKRMGWAGSLAGAQDCIGQRIEPGFTLTEASGPNTGIWYISSATFHIASASQLHPDLLSGTEYMLTDAQQASDCRTARNLPPGSAVAESFHSFNETCMGVPGWSNFITAVWNHEEQHFRQVETAMKQAGNNIYLEIESIVRGTSGGAYGDLNEIYSRIQDAVTAAGGIEPTGNWTTPFWIWASDTQNVFLNVSNPNF